MIDDAEPSDRPRGLIGRVRLRVPRGGRPGPDGAGGASQGLVELLSIAGISAILIFVEFRFGHLSGIARQVVEKVPFGSTMIVALVAGLWAGLAAFSLRRRSELSRALADRHSIAEALDAERITDRLTGLPNMTGFVAYLDMMLAAAPSDVGIDLVGVEVGNLTLIRDVHGPVVEAAVEREVADRLTALAAAGDFVARGVGSTFYMTIARPIGAAGRRTDAVVAAVVDTFRHGLTVGDVTIPARLQVGTASSAGLSARERCVATLVERVDLAIHDSRRKGPGTVSVFDSGMKSALEHRAMIETSLASALKSGEIVPFFQPLIDLSRDKVAGFEVLARWTHAEVGAISPGVFIPIAEEIGVLGPLTLDLLQKSCWAASGWDPSIRLAVNVSPTVLRNPAFLEGFHDVLRRTGFDARRLEVEITENAFLDEVTGLDSAITALKAQGISIAIDDFGTGYSSLHRLRSLPFDKIKIDQSFVRDMMDNTDSRRIVEAIIALANSLGLPTVAEGIEAESNRSLLERLGCSTGQGYLFAPAMPANEVPEFLARYAREGVAVLRRRTA